MTRTFVVTYSVPCTHLDDLDLRTHDHTIDVEGPGFHLVGGAGCQGRCVPDEVERVGRPDVVDCVDAVTNMELHPDHPAVVFGYGFDRY